LQYVTQVMAQQSVTCGPKRDLHTRAPRRRDLLSGRTHSCGCGISRRRSGRHRVKGKRSPTQQAWYDMLRRCFNPNRSNWKHYGGAGVTVCDRWNPKAGGSFENFVADLGERPSPQHSLGRFGDVGDYSPSNCKWMTRREQNEEAILKRADLAMAAQVVPAMVAA
jgi:hypothetical protein